MDRRARTRDVRAMTASMLLAVAVGASMPARADVVLHEFIVDDPTEDLRLGATTSDGAMAAAIQTESGAVPAPNMKQRPPAAQNVYGGSETAGGAGATYRIDRDTVQPPVVSYDDPFTPEVTPFKRQFAYDAINDAFELVVNDTALTRIEPHGTVNADDDQFYADIQVDLVKGEAVRIPSVGPQARVLGIRTEPPTPGLELLRDGADNWFVRAKDGGRIRLAMHIAIDRAVFGSEFRDVEWRTLLSRIPPLSAAVRQAGRSVAARIGVSDALSPAAAARTLVEYFRGFAPSADRPQSSGLALYEELSLTRKGVCRHRAFAFVVTALAIGLPARMVRNEAHAWVEIYDGQLWHRTDLGGAAGRVELQAQDRPAHITPQDPYAWPPGSDSGQAAAERARSGSSGRATGSGSGHSSTSAAEPMAPDPEVEPPDDSSAAVVAVTLETPEARRGGQVHVKGDVHFEGEACKVVRVDLHLRQKGSPRGREKIYLGTLVTDQEGRYDGKVHVARDISTGDYEVIASTPGNLDCGAGESR